MPPVVAICFGKDCRKRKKDIAKLRNELEGHAQIKLASCLKVCKKAPIIVVNRGDGELCLDKIRGKEIRKALIEYIEGKPPQVILKKRCRKQKRKNVIKKSKDWRTQSN